MTNHNDEFAQVIDKISENNQDGVESSDVVVDADKAAKIEIDNAEKKAKIKDIEGKSNASEAIYELITGLIKSRCMKCLIYLVIIVLFLCFIFLIIISVGATVHNYDKGETYFLSFQVIDQQNARDIVLTVLYIFIAFLGGLLKGKHS